jgi:hypothetical protein
MDKSWKRLFLWSSLGSLAVGATLALSRKPKEHKAVSLVFRPIPPDCREVVIWTERFKAEGSGGTDAVAREKYALQPTRFKLWSVLDLGVSTSRSAGTPIYHVTHFRVFDPGEQRGNSEEEHLIGRFYGAVSTNDLEGKSRRANCLARGGILEIDKCYVGGSSNGVLSGETHRSPGPILNYQFYYPPAES